MPVPKQRHNHSRKNRRRGGHRKLTASKMTKCSNCNQMILPHLVCGNCGFYKGKAVVEIKSKIKKASK